MSKREWLLQLLFFGLAPGLTLSVNTFTTYTTVTILLVMKLGVASILA